MKINRAHSREPRARGKVLRSRVCGLEEWRGVPGEVNGFCSKKRFVEGKRRGSWRAGRGSGGYGVCKGGWRTQIHGEPVGGAWTSQGFLRALQITFVSRNGLWRGPGLEGGCGLGGGGRRSRICERKGQLRIGQEKVSKTFLHFHKPCLWTKVARTRKQYPHSQKHKNAFLQLLALGNAQ